MLDLLVAGDGPRASSWSRGFVLSALSMYVNMFLLLRIPPVAWFLYV
jgi:hypothetical protein